MPHGLPAHMSARWFKIFEALKPFAHGQEQCEEMTNAVIRALRKTT